MNNIEQKPKPPLNRIEVTEMAKAVERVRQLTGSTIQTPENAEQIATDLKFLTKHFLDHAGEFITYYFVIADEYEKVLQAFAIINARLTENFKNTGDEPKHRQ